MCNWWWWCRHQSAQQPHTHTPATAHRRLQGLVRAGRSAGSSLLEFARLVCLRRRRPANIEHRTPNIERRRRTSNFTSVPASVQLPAFSRQLPAPPPRGGLARPPAREWLASPARRSTAGRVHCGRVASLAAPELAGRASRAGAAPSRLAAALTMAT